MDIHILLMGDFNYRAINWEAFHSGNNIEMEFFGNVIENGLIQNVGQPRRSRGSDNPNVFRSDIYK